MTKRSQILLSLALVIAAAAVVTTYAITTDNGTVGAEAGHEHGALAATGDEAKPVMLDPESARRIGVTYAVAAFKPFRRTVSVTVSPTLYCAIRPASVWSPSIRVPLILRIISSALTPDFSAGEFGMTAGPSLDPRTSAPYSTGSFCFFATSGVIKIYRTPKNGA